MRKRKGKKLKPEFDQKLLDLARVTRVVRGGRRFRFRATLAIGNRKGKVAIGIGKGADVSDAISKAFNKAKKNLVEIKLKDGTIPHKITSKFKSAKVLLRPTKKGHGIVVGGAVRQIVELAGIKHLSAKILGKGSKVNNAIAALNALTKFKNIEIQDNLKEGEKKESKKEPKINEKNTSKAGSEQTKKKEEKNKEVKKQEAKKQDKKS